MIKKSLAAAAVAIVMAGCVTTQKQRSRAEQFYREHPTELAEKCAATFPPIYREGKTVTLPADTITIKGDSIKCPDVTDQKTGAVTTGAKLKCPDSKTIYIPSLRVDTVESTGNLARIEQQRQLLANKTAEATQNTKELKEARKTAQNRLFIIIGILAAGAAYLSFRIYTLKFK